MAMLEHLDTNCREDNVMLEGMSGTVVFKVGDGS